MQPADLDKIAPEEAKRLLHELHVHQIELEMQNEELRRAQQELEASRTKYFDLYDLAPVGYVTLSEKGLILEANLTAANLLGVERGQLLQQPLTRFIVSEDQDICYRHRKQLFETRAPQACELRMMRKDGAQVWVRIEAIVVPGSGEEALCRAMLSSISERKQAEQEYKTILQTAIDGFWVADTEGRILEVNAAYCKMIGYSREELLRMRIADVEAAETQEETKRHIEKIIAEGADRFQTRHRRKDGAIIDVEIGCQYSSHRGCIFIVFVQNITERKRAEENLALALQETKQRHAEVTALLKGARSVIEHPQFQPAARAIYEACKELVGATAGYVAMLREDGQEFDLLFLDAGGARCTVDPSLPMPLRGLRAEACRALRPVYENAFSQSAHVPLLPPGHVALENVLFAPLVLEGRTGAFARCR